MIPWTKRHEQIGKGVSTLRLPKLQNCNISIRWFSIISRARIVGEITLDRDAVVFYSPSADLKLFKL